MTLQTITATEALRRLDGFSTIIDARSESEYAEDRLPGAVNWPSLTDEERRLVGTEYKQVSPFVAKKRGAALVARNIAAHIEREVFDKPKDWQPLVYCWRGGKRSGSLALVLDQIGFKVHLLEGGYREYRRAVTADLQQLPLRFRYRVLCGKTGSGKSRLLGALRDQGAQVLDLEALANHRGSVLGLVPGSPQPSQKQFDSRVWETLRHFDPEREVWIESESKKVGELRVPETLVERMRASPCVRVELPLEARVQLLMEDYDFFVKDVPAFCERLDALRALRGNEVVNGWQEAAKAGRIEDVVRELLLKHYDPVYLQSMQRNFRDFDNAVVLELPDGGAAALRGAAAKLTE
ncbi:tRNA 2-selenouridine(34) synthase MnmH [Piscinibacter sp.]|uniref:tRNA 2-selenouridine(34) synthase MnmH n=1 Tax=Piscinibacter sp. TaxID=1903157 RepID=UPI002D04B599|nr:tRNA 2-selenouridine(34) synthase MnmH [Albitalea sp.]HUG26102.1 tRNA 2-selenouridine(34) synthase MnmH [Albitalea sp.]